MSLDELIRQDPDLGGRGASSSGRNAGPGGRAAPKTVLVHAPRGRGGDAPRGRGRGWGRHGGFHDRGPQRLVHMHGGPPAGGMLRADPALFVPAGPFLVQGFGSPLAGMPGAMERGFGPAFNGGFGMMGGGYGDFMGPPEPQAVPPPRPVRSPEALSSVPSRSWRSACVTVTAYRAWLTAGLARVRSRCCAASRRRRPGTWSSCTKTRTSLRRARLWLGACRPAPAASRSPTGPRAAGGAQRRHLAGLWRLPRGAARPRAAYPAARAAAVRWAAADGRALGAQPALFKALNDTLSVVGVRVTTSGPDKWSVSDGRTLKRFEDGMVRPPDRASSARPAGGSRTAWPGAAGDLDSPAGSRRAAQVLKAAPAAPERGRLVKDHVLHPVGAAAAAATAASNAAGLPCCSASCPPRAAGACCRACRGRGGARPATLRLRLGAAAGAQRPRWGCCRRLEGPQRRATGRPLCRPLAAAAQDAVRSLCRTGTGTVCSCTFVSSCAAMSTLGRQVVQTCFVGWASTDGGCGEGCRPRARLWRLGPRRPRAGPQRTGLPAGSQAARRAAGGGRLGRLWQGRRPHPQVEGAGALCALLSAECAAHACLSRQ